MTAPLVSFRLIRFKSNRPQVQVAISRARNKFVLKAGRTVQRTAKDSIKRRRSKSGQGNAPSSHTGQLRRKIFFAPVKGSTGKVKGVVIGPEALNPSGGRGLGESLRHLEKGGRGEFKDPVKFSRRAGRGTGRSNSYQVKVGYFQARPFMVPALKKSWPQVKGTLKNILKGP